MALWGQTNQANNAPLFPVYTQSGAQAGQSNVACFGNTLYGNSSPNAISNNRVVGLYGVDTAQVSGDQPTHAGWVLVKGGTGPVLSLTITANGSGYGNLAGFKISNGSANGVGFITANSGNVATITVTNGGAGFNAKANNVFITGFANAINSFAIGAGGTGYVNGEILTVSNGIVNATATVTTNTTGGISSLTITAAGAGFPSNVGSVVAIATANGSGANVVVSTLAGGTGLTYTVQLGGRGNRVHMETIIAMASVANGGTYAPYFTNV